MKRALTILYEDNHLLAVYKDGGTLVQGDRTEDTTLLDLAKEYLKEKYRKPGNVFLGLVHRLDRPVSGVVLFARTSKAASRVARAFRERLVRKTYVAVVEGAPDSPEGTLEDYITRVERRSRVVRPHGGSGGVRAVLRYRVVAHIGKLSLLEIDPETGRHHQIRLQLAQFGYPIRGDLKYGAPSALPNKTIALHAWKLALEHPVTQQTIELSAPPPSYSPWDTFKHFF
ncbi:MAG: RluA family pseudouridine synthase [Chitinivibrionia bacterium]|nr:RluA family pseudouridine synthase [Chitinivibrionia bacterium]